MKSIFTSKLRMELEELRHAHQLEIERRTAEFERAKSNWEEDKERLESKLKEQHDLKLTEVVTLTKLKAEQESKQNELNFKRQIEELKAQHKNEMSDYKTRLAEEHYEKLSNALSKLHTEGNVGTKFVQELALEMVKKAPPQTQRVELLKGELE